MKKKKERKKMNKANEGLGLRKEAVGSIIVEALVRTRKRRCRKTGFTPLHFHKGRMKIQERTTKKSTNKLIIPLTRFYFEALILLVPLYFRRFVTLCKMKKPHILNILSVYRPVN